MRRGLLVALSLTLSALCFANGNLEMYIGMPLMWEKGYALGYEAEARMASGSSGFEAIIPATDRVSFFVADDVIFPYKIDGTINGKEISVSRNDMILLGMSVSLGGIYYVYSGKKLKVPLSLGPRWMWLFASGSGASSFGNNIGIEVGVGAEFYFIENAYVFGRVRGSYDFYTVGSVETADRSSVDNSGMARSLGLAPNIGVGIKL
jgi:hypothetical protein